MKRIETPIAIVGGGPAGLIVAIELGQRGVEAIVIEPNREAPGFPKANATTSRSMEHYRRLGFARRIRAVALPADYPADITYLTRYTGTELARLRGADLKPRGTTNIGNDRWPTAEPLARVQQMNVEPVLREELSKYPSVTFMGGWRAEDIQLDGARPEMVARETSTGEAVTIAADYLVGADGPRSLVRQALGIKYVGESDFDREFFGGKMLATYFRSRDFYDLTGEKSWQYWAMNPEQRGLLCAIDGAETFVHHTTVKDGHTSTKEDAEAALEAAMGRRFSYVIIGFKEWTAGFALVAERLVDDLARPRVFLCGDAAHLFTPTGGQGYNTAVDDGVNLGWKLAAVVQGWGGRKLLGSYAGERRPIAARNTSFARAMAESVGRLPVTADVEEPSKKGEQARELLAERLRAHARAEFDIPGITYGVFYGRSDIVVGDGAHPPSDEWNEYRPSSVPGARAPHVWVGEGRSIHDLFGPNFSLLAFTPLSKSERALLGEDTSAMGALEIIELDHGEARELYGIDRVLVRPDHHIAWRGPALPRDFRKILSKVTGSEGIVPANAGTADRRHVDE